MDFVEVFGEGADRLALGILSQLAWVLSDSSCSPSCYWHVASGT